MKTVMKKMFCLMLVAVLMVGVMPFQAFAAEYNVTAVVTLNSQPVTTITVTGDDSGAAPLDAWMAQAKATLPAEAQAVASCTGFVGESGNPVDATLVAGGWKIFAHFTAPVCDICTKYHARTSCPDYCNDCAMAGHDEGDHCPVCTKYEHTADCTFGCKDKIDCDWAYKHLADCESQKLCAYCNKKGHTVDDGTCPDMYCTSCGVKKDNKLHKPECALIYDCCGGDEANRKHASDCPTYQACCGAAKPGHTDGCAQFYACCGAAKTGSHAATCTQFYSCCGAAKSGNHAAGCTTQKCPEPGCDSYNGHPGLHNIPCTVSGCTKLKDHDGEHTVACSTANCALNLGHTGEHKCACGLFLQKSSSHNESCPFYEAVVINNPNNTYSLKVWAKLWVGETLTKTILLDTFTDLNGTEVVPYIIGNNVSRLESKFPSGYTNTEWTKAVYYYIDSNTTGTVDTNMNVNEEDNVYINLYSQEKLVVARVHTAKIYGIDRSVQVGGFRVGETVTYDDVLKAVSKYYNVSSMKMYTYGDWEKVVAGGNPSTTPYFTVHEGDNVFEVYITGSHKATTTGGTTYKADSSNPKTGDMIFAPAMVLGLSASALAVLYYLNKKRAF